MKTGNISRCRRSLGRLRGEDHELCVRMLKLGVSPTQSTNSGRVPCFSAAACGLVALVRYMIEELKSVDPFFVNPEGVGGTLLSSFAAGGCEEGCLMMLDEHFDWKRKCVDPEDGSQGLLEDVDDYGSNFLLSAC